MDLSSLPMYENNDCDDYDDDHNDHDNDDDEILKGWGSCILGFLDPRFELPQPDHTEH